MKNKFTLIELLVVVAIIGILVTLLLPSLSKAREIAKHAVCQSNKKQHYTVVATYGKNNKNKYPNVHPSRHNAAGVDDDQGDWFGANGSSPTMVNSIVSRYSSGNETFLRCPSISPGTVGSGVGGNGVFDQSLIGAFSDSYIGTISSQGYVWPTWDATPTPFVVVETSATINGNNIEDRHSGNDARATPHLQKGSYIGISGAITIYRDLVANSMWAGSFYVDLENGNWSSLSNGSGNWDQRVGISARR